MRKRSPVAEFQEGRRKGLLHAPEFPPEMEWTGSRPVRLADLRGRLVLLHFWTYG
ncbi:MAG: hypothetical protein QJR14_04805 [Bacillota bacterium]|nr:hypothetical protein [Bacillota bacterium]